MRQPSGASAGGAGRRSRPTLRRDARLIILQVLVVALLATLFMRLVWMQVGEGATYRNAASSNSVRTAVVTPQRGLILDQVGRPIVANRSSLTVTVDRTALAREKDGGQATLVALAKKLSVSYDDLVTRMKPCGTAGAAPQPLCWNGPAGQPVVVATDVPQTVGLQLMEERGDMPAVRTDLRPLRSYPKPYGVNAAHLAGYLGPISQAELDKLDPTSADTADTRVGRAGLEEQYNSVLAGQPGVQRVAVSRSGKVGQTLENRAAVPGDNVVTNIDAHLQAVVEEQLQAALDLARKQDLPGDSGSIVVTDVTNGHVLALASAPTYDPGLWVGGISAANYAKLTSEKRGNPLLDRATQGVYSPASTFKAISTAAVLEAGYSGSQKIPCPSSYDVGGQSFSNYESHAYGDITLARALSVSCDTVFYRLANQLWQKDGGLASDTNAKEVMVNEARDFGLGKKTGIDLPGEYAGRIIGRAEKKANYAQRKDDYCKRASTGYPEVQPAERAKLLKAYARDFCAEGDRYRAGDALNFAIGQGETGVTPLQMTMAYAAIANGGTLWQPQLSRAVVDQSGAVVSQTSPQEAGKLTASAATLRYIRDALSNTVVDGTASGVFQGFPNNKVRVAAKTGTAEVVGKTSTSWFASFAPAQAPKYAVTCMVAQGGTGSGTCGPSVRAIYAALYGVSGSTVDPAKSVLKGGQPSVEIPAVTSDGMGQGSGSESQATPGPTDSAVATKRPSAQATQGPAGESAATATEPSPTPSGPSSETGIGLLPSDRPPRSTP